MANTDIQNIAFTQIAYMDLAERFEFYDGSGQSKVPLSDILYPSEIRKLKKIGITEDEINSWKLAAVHDTNSENGFYACVVETGEGAATVAFRGSESLGNLENLYVDWVNADLKLLNSTLTTQEAETDRFMEQNKGLLGGYENLSVTGHSLGGHLAEYFTIVSDQYGLDDNIEECNSLDGPNFSKAFQDEHSAQIEKMGSKMTHYRWSFVGGLLPRLPIGNSHYKDLEVKKDDSLFYFITRHSTNSIDCDGGHFNISTKAGNFAGHVDPLSVIFDRGLNVLGLFPSQIVVFLLSVAFALLSETVLFVPDIIKDLKSEYINYKVKKELSNNPDFYIDTEAFDIIAGKCLSIEKKLQTIKKELDKLHYDHDLDYGVYDSVDFFPDEIKDFLRGRIQWLNSIIAKIEAVLCDVSYAKVNVEECNNTLSSVRQYLEETSTEFRNVELAAIQQMNSFSGESNGK